MGASDGSDQQLAGGVSAHLPQRLESEHGEEGGVGVDEGAVGRRDVDAFLQLADELRQGRRSRRPVSRLSSPTPSAAAGPRRRAYLTPYARHHPGPPPRIARIVVPSQAGSLPREPRRCRAFVQRRRQTSTAGRSVLC